MSKKDERPAVSDPGKFNWEVGDVKVKVGSVGGACATCLADPCTCGDTSVVELVTPEEQLAGLAKVEEEPDLPEPVKAYEEYIPDTGELED